MIRYPVTSAALRTAIDDLAPTWFEQAATRTAAYAAAGAYVTPPSDIWSKVKTVYMQLQGYKCGFCERRLERSAFGNVEHDVEHFRPKARVDAWSPSGAPPAGLPADLGAASPDQGYYLLPHHHENYLIACKTCNTAFKRNGFPVEGARDLAMTPPRGSGEAHLLAYPIGSVDDDPQRLVRFEGIVPVPAAASGRRRRRGQVIIRFFGLAERDGLLLERSLTLVGLHLALAHLDEVGLTGDLARHLAASLTQSSAAHAGCARSFVGLWAEDRSAAEAFGAAALAHLRTVP